MEVNILHSLSRTIVPLLIVSLVLSCFTRSPTVVADKLGIPTVATKVREILATKQGGGGGEAAFEKKIDVGSYGLHIGCSAKSIKEGPTVILEAGLNQGKETWTEVHLEVAKFARVCSYDRAGLSKSDASPDKQTRTSQEMVKELHLLLDKAGVTAPLVLVGHSFDGVNVRLFASLYPKEVVGIVLVDSVHEEETEKWLAMISPEIRKQIEAGGGRELLGVEKVDLETSMKQLQAAKWRTDIPLIVLARGRASFNLEDYAPPLRPFAPKGEELRVEMQKDLAARSTNGSFLFAEKSGHMIQEDEPGVVVSAVRKVVASSRPKGGTP